MQTINLFRMDLPHNKLPHLTFLQGIITRSITCTLRMQLKACPACTRKNLAGKSSDVDTESRGARTVSLYKSGSRGYLRQRSDVACALVHVHREERTRAHGKHGESRLGT